jgi:hypothetical protein
MAGQDRPDIAENGVLRDDGAPRPSLREYAGLAIAARQAFGGTGAPPGRRPGTTKINSRKELVWLATAIPKVATELCGLALRVIVSGSGVC